MELKETQGTLRELQILQRSQENSKDLKEIRLNSMGFTGTPETSRDLQRTYRHPETSRDLKVLPETSRALSKTSRALKILPEPSRAISKTSLIIKN